MRASKGVGTMQRALEAVEDAGKASMRAQKVPGWVGGDNLIGACYRKV